MMNLHYKSTTLQVIRKRKRHVNKKTKINRKEVCKLHKELPPVGAPVVPATPGNPLAPHPLALRGLSLLNVTDAGAVRVSSIRI